MEILCFCASFVFFYTKNVYSLLFIAIVLLFKRSKTIILWTLAAIIWCAIHQWWLNDSTMPNVTTIPSATVEGTIASIPSQTTDKMQFYFLIKRFNHQVLTASALMSCYQSCPNVQAGDYWRLHVKLKKAKNLRNPGSFDYERWLKSRHIDWIGTIQNKPSELVTRDFIHYPLLILRQQMACALSASHLDIISQGIVEALTLGITTHIDVSNWDLFRKTGTTHLMVISGAHIGFIAGMIYNLVTWLWCWFPRLCLLLPAQKMASSVAFLIAACYSLLASFSASTQRALIMCFFMFLPNFIDQKIRIWQSLRYALLVVLVLEPHSVLMPGFYLSFLAVAILVCANQKFQCKGLKKMGLLQMACLVGLMPLTLFWFSYGAINGFFANLLAIPWVSFIIVPISLLTILLGQWGIFSYNTLLLSKSIHLLLTYLAWVDSFSWMNLKYSVTQILSPLAFMTGLCLLIIMPIARLAPAALILLLIACFPFHETIKADTAQMDVLDVGQGLAIVIRTAKHVLVYDAGVQLYQGGDMGQRVVIPYLDTLNIKRLDKVIISHPDLDHRGGLPSLEKKYPIDELLVDNPAFYKRGKSCHDYPDWTWDGISFHFFANPSALQTKNNSSCVLQISNSKHRFLLTGDIENQAEKYLIKTYGTRLSSQVLVIPHHGSKTSSSNYFLDSVSPKYAIASFGLDNRYHFPHPIVMQRYRKHQITVYNTADCGMISAFLRQGDERASPIRQFFANRTCDH